MGRLFISRQELEKVFGGAVEVGKAGIFVQDGGNGLLGQGLPLSDWTNWTGEESMGQPVIKRKRPEPKKEKNINKNNGVDKNGKEKK